MSERVCGRGCLKRGIHYAACKRSGDDYDGPFPCPGCAPRECRDGSLICDACFGRARSLLGDIVDLLARLRSLADPSKAHPTDQAPGGAKASEPPAPVPSDLLDAIHAVEALIRSWAHWFHHLPEASNRTDMLPFFALILDRHQPDEDGMREAWSLQDAMDKWGAERRPGRNEQWTDTPNLEPSGEDPLPITEHGDPLITKRQAEKLAGSTKTLERWRRDELIQPEMTIWTGARPVPMYRYRDVLAVKDRLALNRGGRPMKEAS